MQHEFDWIQPIGQKALRWKPLTVGQKMDIEASYASETERHLQKYVALAWRVTLYDGKKGPLEMADLRSWDAFDLDEFANEVALREQIRAAQFRKDPGTSVASQLEKVSDDLELAMNSVVLVVRKALQCAKQAESRPLEASARSS